MFVLMDGLLVVEVDGSEVAQLGPGTIVGERASIEGGRRTATLRSSTPVRVAVVSPDQIDSEARVDLAAMHGGEKAGEV